MEVQVEVGDRPRIAVPVPEDSLDTVLVHSGKDLSNLERSLQNAARLKVWDIGSKLFNSCSCSVFGFFDVERKY